MLRLPVPLAYQYASTRSPTVPRGHGPSLLLAAALAMPTACARERPPTEEHSSARPNAPGDPSRGSTCRIYSGPVTEDATLYKACSPYVQPGGGIDVINGATLTIEAGVEIRFRDRDWLEVGAGGKPGRLVAKGSAQDPIVITSSSSETPDNWFGVWFHKGTLEGSVLSHAIVRHAGGDNRFFKPTLQHGCITLTGVKPGVLQIADVRTEHCVNGGLRLIESGVDLQRLTLADTPLGIVSDAASLGSVTEVATHQNVSHGLLLGGQVPASASWIAQPVPYRVHGDVGVQGPGAPVLTLQPGLSLHFAPPYGLRIGIDESGELVAVGTRDAPIRLVSADSEAGWAGVHLGRHTAAGTRLELVELDGTTGDAAIRVDTEAGRVEIRSVTFSNEGAGISVACGAEPRLGQNRHTRARSAVLQSACGSAGATRTTKAKRHK